MKKISFSERYGLQQAVLNGTKTMTRRIVPIGLYNQTDWKAVEEGDYEAVVDGNGDYHDIRCCGRYRIGEEVAIAQAYNTLRWPSVPGIDWDAIVDEVTHAKGWKNKMFVKAKYMPHRIRITDIRVERLRDISYDECMKEGVYKYDNPPLYHEFDPYAPWPPYVKPYKRDYDNLRYYCNPFAAFGALINRISGRGTWQRNPWVFVYEFELIK